MSLDNQSSAQVTIEINANNSQVHTRQITRRNGTPGQARHQEAYLHQPGKPYPQPFRLSLSDSQAPYAPGTYLISPESYVVGRYGDLELSRYGFVLVPVEQKRAA